MFEEQKNWMTDFVFLNSALLWKPGILEIIRFKVIKFQSEQVYQAEFIDIRKGTLSHRHDYCLEAGEALSSSEAHYVSYNLPHSQHQKANDAKARKCGYSLQPDDPLNFMTETFPYNFGSYISSKIKTNRQIATIVRRILNISDTINSWNILVNPAMERSEISWT